VAYVRQSLSHIVCAVHIRLCEAAVHGARCCKVSVNVDDLQPDVCQ